MAIESSMSSPYSLSRKSSTALIEENLRSILFSASSICNRFSRRSSLSCIERLIVDMRFEMSIHSSPVTNQIDFAVEERFKCLL